MVTEKSTWGALFLLVVSSFLAGCQTSQTLYDWNQYDTALYQYYKTPEQQKMLEEVLLSITEDKSARVPPGIYAEYGTLMLQQGKTDEAITYYEKEKALWPESQPLMDTMIKALTDEDADEKAKES